MSRLSCDVAIVGTELSALCAGALVAHAGGQKGRRVVVIDDGDAACTAPIGDRLAPAAPTLWRLPSSGPVSSIFDGLGLKQDARRHLGDAAGLGVVDDPDVRLLLSPDAAARQLELLRVFGADAAAAMQALLESPADPRHALLQEAAHLHEDGFFFEARKSQKRVDALGAAGRVDGDEPSLRAFGSEGLWPVLSKLAPFLQSLDVSATARGLAALLALSQVQNGVHVAPRGGLGLRAALRDLFTTVIKNHGGEVVSQAVEHVESDGKTIGGLKLQGQNDYSTRVVVDGTTGRTLTARLPASRRRDKLQASEARVALSSVGVSTRWLVPVADLPRGMPPLLVNLEAQSSGTVVGVYGGAPLPGTQRAAAVDEKAVVVVAAGRCAPAEQANREAQLEALLDHLMPFARGRRRAQDHASAAATTALGGYTVHESEHPVGGRRPRTPYANLLRAGRDLVPAFGIDGELVAARSVAALAEQLLGAQQKA